jgi:hypothetical protein
VTMGPTEETRASSRAATIKTIVVRLPCLLVRPREASNR